MTADRLSEILKKARQKEGYTPAQGHLPSFRKGIKNLFSHTGDINRLTYVAGNKNESGIDPRVISYYAPDSPIAEQYRTLRTHMFATKQEQPLKAILFSSSHPREGKTLTAVNLAATIALDSSKKVLLLDADLRKGEIKEMLGLSGERGLSEVLSGKLKVDEVIQNTKIPGLSAITCGLKSENPSELLNPVRIREILNLLKAKFDHIFLDTPPVISVTDGPIFAPLADGIVLVIKAEVTPLKIIEHTQFLLQQAKGKIIGYVIVNVEYYIPEVIYKYL